MKSVFRRLKKGMRVTDTWYGAGKVVKVLKTRVDIKFYHTGEVWRYDAPHVNGFVKIGWK